MYVKNKVCLITGSAQGLGKAFAIRLLSAGAKVCISDIKEDLGKATLAELSAKFGEDMVVYVSCDVTKEDQLVNLFDEAEKVFGVSCVDLVVNNAGINNSFGWRKCMEVNIMGVMAATEIAWSRMKKSANGGTIVNIGSMAGVLTGWAETATGYCASKHGVVSLTRTLHSEFKHTGVSVKCLCPGWTDTEMVSGVKEEHKSTIQNAVSHSGGIMTPDYVAEAFFKLVTECSSGSCLAVIKGVPFFILPDMGLSMVKVLSLTAKMVGHTRNMELVQGKDLAMGLTVVIFLFLAFLFKIIISWIF